jgi:hypothetical protein
MNPILRYTTIATMLLATTALTGMGYLAMQPAPLPEPPPAPAPAPPAPVPYEVTLSRASLLSLEETREIYQRFPNDVRAREAHIAQRQFELMANLKPSEVELKALELQVKIKELKAREKAIDAK